MYKLKSFLYILLIVLAFASCKLPNQTTQTENKSVPIQFVEQPNDSTNSAALKWREFFKDPFLLNLIEEALKGNQELKSVMQEISITRNDILMRQGAILPRVYGRGATGVEKVGRYTSQGAGDASADITPGKRVPDYLMDNTYGAFATWEVDIWKKLRTAKQAAVLRYASSVEGKNFVVTNLVAEVAHSYYELLALDNQLAIIQQYILLQQEALNIVKLQKEAARATELAVKKFEAEVLKSQHMQYDVRQGIVATENRINFLLGRFPQPIPRSQTEFLGTVPEKINAGLPSQLLLNRPDVKQAELDLSAAKLDVKVARAEFLPSLGISAGLGFQAFKPSYLLRTPESILFSFAGDLIGPLINKAAIRAEFNNANARQLQSIYNYEKTVLNAYMEVATQLKWVSNLQMSYDIKSKQVDALNVGISVSNDLFKSARADYLEVLMTQRDALEAKLELVETKKQQMSAVVSVYRNLGGGWK